MLASEMGGGLPLFIILLIESFFISHFLNWNLFTFQMPLPIFLASEKLISAVSIM